MSDQDTRKFDVILWGGTSFVGKLTAEFLYQRHGVDGDLKWALGGRNEEKLTAFRETLGLDADQIPMVIGDAQDEDFLARLVSYTKVVLTTVGPYSLYGRKLVAACAEAGTDYCDLTGEIPFIQDMIDEHTEMARQTGARILHCCGVDSIPSDAGVWFLNKYAMETYGEPLASVTTEARAFKGAFSGGTVASLGEVWNQVSKSKETRKAVMNPYSLCPDGLREGVKQPNLNAVKKSPVSKRWLAPFIMASINSKVVHATNAMRGYPYGEAFTYGEHFGVKNIFQAQAIGAGMAAGFVGYANPLTRPLVKGALPSPGEGPSRKQQEEGEFTFMLFVETASGRKIVGQVTGDRDPGYGSTSKMIGEVAACLAQDVPSRNEVPGGVMTVGASIVDYLIPRLVEHSGLTFEILEG
ncbi:MAG: saccharopine dehydrogenase NADP-binding domain-containing protein [Pseudomonadota bacterium]